MNDAGDSGPADRHQDGYAERIESVGQERKRTETEADGNGSGHG